MANGASDGSVIIDTGLDSTGFEKGSDKMERSIKGVTQAINQSGQAAASSMRPILSAFAQVGKTIDTTAQSAQSLDGKLSGAVSSSDFGRGMTAAERSCASLERQMQRLSDSERMGIKTSAQMTRFQLNTEKARDSVTRLEQELQRLGGQQIATSEYEQLAASAKRAEQALFKMYDRRDTMSDLGVSESSREWQRLALQIKNAEYTLDSYERAMESMRTDGTAFTSGADTGRYQQVQATLNGMMGQLSRYEQMAGQFDTISAPAQKSESALKGVDEELKHKVKDAGAASGAFKAFGSVLKNAASVSLKVTSALAKMSFKAISSGAKKAAGAIGKFFGKTEGGTLSAQGLVKSLTSLKRMIISRVKEKLITSLMQGLQQSITALAQYSSAFNSSMSSMKNAMTGLSGNLAVSFGNIVNAIAPAITSIINLVSRAVSYLNAFFAMLSGKSSVTVAKKQTDSYAQSLGGAAGAAKELKNEVYGFDELNKASSTSDGGGGGGGGGTGDMFEDVPIESLLPDSVQNFFNSIKTAFEAGDWEGIGLIIGDGLNVAVTAVDNWITSVEPFAVEWSSRIARIFNGLVTGFDWTNLGTMLANGLNLLVHTINEFTTTFDWTALGTSLGAGANSLVDGIDWAALGVLFVTKTRVIWDTLYGAFTTFNWSALGSNIAKGANAAFNSIDWNRGAIAFGAGIQGVWTAFWTAVGEFDWENVGSTLAEAVNTLFASEGGPINWEIAAQNMSTGLKGIFDGINTFLAETDWQQIGNDAAIFLGGIDWSGLVSSICEGIGLALGSFAELVWGLIEPAWNDVVTWWNTEMEANGGDIIATLLSGIVTALTNIGTWCKDNIITPLLTGIETALGLEDGTIAQVAVDLWNGLKEGLANAWNSLKETIVQPFKDFWQAVKDFFGIASPSTEAATIGDYILQGFSGGLLDGVQAVLDVVADVFGRIWNAIKSIFGFGDESEEGKDAKQAGKDIMTGMKEGITGDEEAVKTAIKNAAKNVLSALRTELGIPDGGGASSKTKSIGEGIVTGLKDGISAKGIQATFTSAANTTWSAVKSALESSFGLGFLASSSKNTKYIGEGVVSGIKDGISSKGVKSTFTTSADGVYVAVQGALNTSFGLENGATSASKTKYVGDGIVAGIVEGISGRAVAGTFALEAANVKTAITSAFNTALGMSSGNSSASKFWEIGKAICQGVADGISANTGTIRNAATQAAKAALSAAKSKLGIHSPSKAFAEIGGFMMEGMSNGLSSAQNGVIQTIANIADSITKGFSSDIAGFSPNVELTGNAVVDGMDTVASKLSGIASTFESIAAMLTAVGGFTMPAVAAGSVVPYRTRVAADSPSTGNSDPFTAFTTNFDETMSDQRDLLQEIIDILRRLNLTVDGDSLMRAITYLQRAKERSYGGA